MQKFLINDFDLDLKLNNLLGSFYGRNLRN